jgi:hypothetical protein
MFIAWVVTTFMGIVGGIVTHQTFIPQPPPTIVTLEKPILVHDNNVNLDEFGKGWVADHDQIKDNLDPEKTLQFSTTPAGKAIQAGDTDVYLWQIVRKVNNKAPPWYPNINQGSVGCCVGAGTKHACDVVQATAIASGQQFEWKPICAEVIYSVSRIQVGNSQIRGDGSTGRWAMQALRDVGAFVPMEKIGSYDLTSFSAARARQWGSGNGVPSDVLAIGKTHLVKGAALVTSAADVKKALSQGYPISVCSSIGFNNTNGTVGTRDAQGFIKPRGTWPHCMCLMGWRNGDRPGAFCLNSWGDSAHSGPTFPTDAPVAGFWIDESVVDQMVRQGDSFALSDVQGFPARKPKPDWFIMNIPVQPEKAEFALAP